jgi:alkylation response protein AidB-like acyl-CoA dehydrogenase
MATAMDFDYTPEQEAFRREIRTWLEANLPEALKVEDTQEMTPKNREVFEARRAFQKKLQQAGWAGIWWPGEYGGRGAGIMEQAIYDEECERARVPKATNYAPINQWGPTLMQWGTDAQKKRLLPPMLSGEETWCQGYSEPNAGSDLAGLQTRAVDQGDYFVVNGQKIWTSAAQYADWMYMLVRTDPAAPKHRGISCIYLDLHSPGVEVRPLVSMAGTREFNEVFFDNVQVPKGNLVGPLNEGWRVAMTTLNFERAISGGRGHLRMIERLTELAKTVAINGRLACEDRWVRQQLAQLRIEFEALRYTGYRALTRQLKGLPPGPEFSMMRVAGADLLTRICRFTSEMLGGFATLDQPSESVPDAPEWLNRLMSLRGVHIGGGTTEISRNIIGERTLGLPKG